MKPFSGKKETRAEETARFESIIKSYESTQSAMDRRMEQCETLVALMTWVQSGKYRSITHRHTGTFKAVDQAYSVSWEADTLERLIEDINTHKPVERAP